MKSASPLLQSFIDALRCLPGVGPKSAQRMAFHLLERQREQALALAQVIEQAIEQLRHCQQCNNFCETDRCHICQDSKRQAHLLCVVESPADCMAIEQSGVYRGQYFVLMGHLSPIDGIGPEQIAMSQLMVRLQDSALQEVILATNPTVEGEATAHYIAELGQTKQLSISRIAHGVPLGGELEFINSNTLSRAIEAREKWESSPA